MAKLGDLMMDFAPYVPGMPEPLVRRFLSIALDEFLTRSEVWREEWPHYYPDEGTGNTWYADFAETGFVSDERGSENTGFVGANSNNWKRVVKVTDVYYRKPGGPSELIPYISIERLRQLDPNFQSTLGTKPQYWYTIYLYEAPWVGIYPRAAVEEVGVLFPSVIYSVKRQDTWDTAIYEKDGGLPADGTSQFFFPDFIYWNYGQAVVSGAVARALVVPGKDWSNPQLATYHRSLFEEAVIKAKSAAEAGFTNHVDRVVSYGGY